MWWRLAIVVAGVVGIIFALAYERFAWALLLFVVTLFVAWIEGRAKRARDEAAANERARRLAKTQAQPPTGAAAPQPAVPGKAETTLTLWAANEQAARQLMDDQYFLLGGLMANPSEAGARFLDALGQGGTISGQATPNLTRGGYDVRLTVVQAAPAKTAPGTCPYCGAVLAKDGSGARIKLNLSESRPGEQGSFCPECGHEFEPADLQKLKAGAPAPAPPSPKVPGAYTGPPIADLTQSDVIEELVKAGIDRESAEAQVQVSIVGASTFDAAEIRAIHFSDGPLMVKDLATRWAVHCIYHGAKPRIV